MVYLIKSNRVQCIVTMDVIMFLLLKERWTAYFHELDLIMFIEITWVRKAMFMYEMQPKGVVITRYINSLISQQFVKTLKVAVHTFADHLDCSTSIRFKT